MKEITRIHLAKVAYDIELDAKKEIQHYIAALERYADDAELLGDIEIRITELLAERGVAAGGVIGTDDVAAVRAQLGEPSDFAPEAAGDIAVGGDEPRRVYRDTDHAIAGGVLAGFARFFGIDPLWVRLVFIVLLFASFGAALIVYLILWAIIPPAETAAQKLQMRGAPVTLESIKAVAGEPERVSRAAEVTRTVLRMIGGALLLLVGTAALIGTIAAVASVFFGFGSSYSPIADWQLLESWWFVTMMVLFAVSGLLLAALAFVLASAVFRRSWNKRIGTTVAVIVIAGLTTCAAGVGTAVYGNLEEQGRAQAEWLTTKAALPAEFGEVKAVVVDARADDSLRVEYIVSDTPRYELESSRRTTPDIKVGEDGVATVSVKDAVGGPQRPWDFSATAVLRVYGPALERLEARANAEVYYYNDKAQAALALTLQSAGFELRGTYDTVTIVQRESGMANLESATVGDLMVDNQSGVVEAGVVRTLTVTQPDACPANAREDGIVVHVQAVSGGQMHYNGTERAATTLVHDCGKVVIGDDDEFEWNYKSRHYRG